MTDMIEELERALGKARDRFREYEDEEARLLVSDAPYARGLHAAEQSKHREMANMLDGAIASTLPQLLSLAKLGLLVREGGEEVVAAIARGLANEQNHIIGKLADPIVLGTKFATDARAVLRALEGLVK